MCSVAGDDGEVVQERNGSDLLVNTVLLVYANENAPDLGAIQIERQNMLRKLSE